MVLDSALDDWVHQVGGAENVVWACVGSRAICFESRNTGVGQFLDRRFDRMARRGLAASKLAVVNR